MSDLNRHRPRVPRSSARSLCLGLAILGLVSAGCAPRAKPPVSGERPAAASAPVEPRKGAPRRAPEQRSKATTPSPAPARKSEPRYPLITPIQTPSARVISVNAELRFVVLDFSLNPPAAAQQRLGVYREDLKVGEVRITRWASGRNVVANIVKGEAQVGDEARED